jgi:hypothetical protein
MRAASLEAMCYEERVLYRLLSGMHMATNVHVNTMFFAPRKGVRAAWEPNPDRFVVNYKDHPERLENMYFAYVVLLRAAKKAARVLRQVDYGGPSISEAEVVYDRVLEPGCLLRSAVLPPVRCVVSMYAHVLLHALKGLACRASRPSLLAPCSGEALVTTPVLFALLLSMQCG